MISQEAVGTVAINADSFVDELVEHAEIVCCESTGFHSSETSTFICIGNSDMTRRNHLEEDSDNDESGSWTFLNFLSTWYLPLIFLWLRRSMFGTANLFRSILVGQFLRLVLVQCGDQQKWVEPFVEPPSAFTSNSDTFLYNIELPKWFEAFMDSNAWPPPALTALGVLTFVAFVVHPDGLTWFMLGKLRDAILSILHSFVSCWTMFIQDYGIITTTVALMTLAGIGCLLGILLKNALPKNNSKRALPPEKKKKKRKGMKGKGGRVRQFRCNSSNNAKPIPEDEQVEETSADLLLTQQTVELEPSSPVNIDNRYSIVVPLDKSTNSGTEAGTEPLGRPRTLTGDTSCDDTSCDSASIRSFASAPTAVTIGSTENSESTKPGKNPKRNNRRKQSHVSSKRGGKKVSPSQASSDSVPADKPSTRCNITSSDNLQLPPNESRGFRNSNHYTKETTPTTGRFANLKERDTRFDNVSSNNYRRNGTRNGGKGRGQQGRNNRNSNSRTPALQSVSFVSPPVSIQERDQQAVSLQKPSFSGSRSPSIQVISNNQNQCDNSVQYGSPYSCSSDHRRKKEELRSLFHKVGLIGNEAASLASNVADVEALERLSDRQLQLYGIPADKRARLCILFAGRRQHSEIRPPPGLPPVHDEPPTLFGSSNRSPSLYLPQLSAKTFQQKPLAHMFAYDEHQQLTATDEESRIEAELQELGGQMVGSILDF